MPTFGDAARSRARRRRARRRRSWGGPRANTSGGGAEVDAEVLFVAGRSEGASERASCWSAVKRALLYPRARHVGARRGPGLAGLPGPVPCAGRAARRRPGGARTSWWSSRHRPIFESPARGQPNCCFIVVCVALTFENNLTRSSWGRRAGRLRRGGAVGRSQNA